ncbi:MAG: HPr kinase/phosphatase C-terminal domain-containing protein [Candidatus Saccharibacteria bacterium]|nr:HPr kinase/phosphatase C-terminal domain-containing protein [Pseudorhodobacter sp.]
MTSPVLLHASCVAISGRGVLIIGPSGSGKSALALQLMAYGASLVADDQTELTVQGGTLIARCPPTMSGLIEARGLGILRAQVVAQATVHLVVDRGTNETDRLPPHRTLTLLGTEVDLVLNTDSNHFPAAVLCYLTGSRQA